jgi:two-component system chemotaxis family response regulator WspR
MEANLELQRLNNVDGLTGLSNRRYFDEVIDAEWKRCTRAQTSVALLMIDVDNFKQYNDTYGHMAGDEVLKKVSNAVRKSCERATDVAARFGGEEFAVVLPSTDLAGAVHLAEKVRQSIAALALVHSGSTTGAHLSVSIGVASAVPQRGDSYADVIKTADQALYEAKRSGRNRVVMKSLVDAAKA